MTLGGLQQKYLVVLVVFNLIVIFNIWYLRGPKLDIVHEFYISTTEPPEETDLVLLRNPYKFAPPYVFNETDESLLYFLHIPKTGGMTLYNLLTQVQKIRNPVRRLDLTFAATSTSLKIAKNHSDFKNFLKSQRISIGHVDKSIELVLHPRPVQFVTFLREPVQRAMSLYYFVKRNTVRAECLVDISSPNRTICRKDSPKRNMTHTLLPPDQLKIAREKWNRTRHSNITLVKPKGNSSSFRAVSLNVPYLFKDLPQNETIPSDIRSWLEESHLTESDWREDQGFSIDEAHDVLEDLPDYLKRTDQPRHGVNLVQSSFADFTPNTTVMEFVSMMVKQQMDNYMVRAYTGLTEATFRSKRSIFDQYDPESLLTQAKEFLVEIPFFGITERYSESVELMLWSFGMNASLAEKIQARNVGKSQDPLLKAYAHRIEALDWADIRLYRFAKALFAARLDVMKFHKLKEASQEFGK